LKGTGLNASIMTFSAGKQLEIYDFTRKLLHEDRLIFPKDSQWSSKLKEELFGIQLIKGRKIDHRKDSSKDLADCVCAVAWHLMSDQTASLSFDTTVQRTVRRNNPNDEFADLGFQSSGRPLAGQIRRGYSGWGTNSNGSGSWSHDEY
jgi:hypothetical protein